MKTIINILSLLLILVSAPQSRTVVEEKPMSDSSEVEIGGEYMKAFLAAYDAFRGDVEIPSQKRHIENYILRFSQDKHNYLVFFLARRTPEERDLAGGESKLGKDVRYTIRKSDSRVVSRLFFK